ncbi:MAG TPA: rhodanese-like domain-containing protein [Candidatus Acidoferrales bacterium]|nr:rhodanese-like domain-containing protein [Candidatus Acidoferrales bacterium]
MADDLFANIEIAPRDVEELAARGEGFLLVDVRERWEHRTARIEGAVLIPLREIPAKLSSLAGASEIVLFCHHGMRSLDAAAWLRSQGVKGARSMSGGIDRWAVEVDPLVPRY